MRKTIALFLAATMLAVASPVAADGTVSEPIVDGLIGPLGLAVGADGTLYIAQSFAGMLTKVDTSGVATPIAFAPYEWAFLAGVHERDGVVTYTVSGENQGDYLGLVEQIAPDGRSRTLGDPGTHEETRNPDRQNVYGFLGLDRRCARQVPAEIGGGFPYRGLVDSNSYAVTELPNGTMVVADAGGNDLVTIASNGRVRTLTVLPPQPSVVTADVAALFGLPDCAIGATYNFDPVPTDVELGPDGMLYVSTLPGGPEDDSLGARGSVYRVDPATGAATMVATGFLGATDLAVTPDGTIYVTELFGNALSKVAGSGREWVADLDQPAAVEWANGMLYVTVGAFGNGAVVTVTP